MGSNIVELDSIFRTDFKEFGRKLFFKDANFDERDAFLVYSWAEYNI